MIDLDGELVDKVRDLKLKFTDEPQPELLIRILNSHRDVEYSVEVSTSEFTSLCPLNTSQPDYATITIRYIPEEWCVELKSLKFYLVSFRNVPIFHEQVPTTVLKALVELLKPKELVVEGQFTVRGGIYTKVTAIFPVEEPVKR